MRDQGLAGQVPVARGRLFAAHPGVSECLTCRNASVRMANIDRLRIMAAFGIVWFHTPAAPGRAIAYSGLPILLLLFVSLLTSQSHGSDARRFVIRRWNRLVVPWLFWCGVYAICRFGQAVVSPYVSDTWQSPSLATLLVGTHIHLWYLPYAFIWGLIVWAIEVRTRYMDNRVVVAAALIVTVLAMLGYLLTAARCGLGVPWAQWAFSAPAIPLGFAIGRCQTARDEQTRRLSLLVVALGGALACLTLCLTGHASPGVPYGIAAILVPLAYLLPGRQGLLTAWATPLTFGIYLLHPLVDYAVRHVISAEVRTEPLAVSVFCLSAALTWALMQTPLKRFL